MSDLAAFLRARLDEDERNAEEALAQWRDTHFTFAPGSLVIVGFHRTHDPARVLREVEADRKLIHRALRFEQMQLAGDATPQDIAAAGEVHRMMRYRAAVYSDHPDYQKDWA